MLPSHLCYLVTSILLPAQALLLEDQSFSLSIDSSEAGLQEEMLQRMWSRVIPDFETLWKVLKSFVIVLEFGESAFWRENIMEDVDRSKLRVRLGSEKCSCIDLTCGQMTTLEKFNWPLHNHRNILDFFLRYFRIIVKNIKHCHTRCCNDNNLDSNLDNNPDDQSEAISDNSWQNKTSQELRMLSRSLSVYYCLLVSTSVY